MKINFTQEHMTRLKELACEMLFSNTVIKGFMGAPANIIELLHGTTINTLNNLKASLSKQIEKLESADEWVGTDSEKLAEMRKAKELVNLIVGWKRYNLEIAENNRRIAEIEKQLIDIDEATKTPEDKKKELRAELEALKGA